MRSYFFFLVSFSIYFAFFNVSHSAIESKILAKVENQLISSFELKNKIKLILFLTNQDINQKNINNTKREALESLINLKLKKEEVLKFKIADDASISANKYIVNLSTKYNTDTNGLKKILKNNNIDYDLFFEEVKIEMAWQKIIYNIYKDKVNINDGEIEEELKTLIKKNKKIEEYKLSEIEILVENISDAKAKIQEIKKQIDEIGFENTAIKYSLSATALNGGDLGWINSNSLSKKVIEVITKIKKGEVSAPLVQANSVLFLKLIDVRSNKNNISNLEKLKRNIVSSKQNDILNLFSNNHLSKIRNNALIDIR